jgi:hypothetical protein
VSAGDAARSPPSCAMYLRKPPGFFAISGTWSRHPTAAGGIPESTAQLVGEQAYVLCDQSACVFQFPDGPAASALVGVSDRVRERSSVGARPSPGLLAAVRVLPRPGRSAPGRRPPGHRLPRARPRAGGLRATARPGHGRVTCVRGGPEYRRVRLATSWPGAGKRAMQPGCGACRAAQRAGRPGRDDHARGGSR